MQNVFDTLQYTLQGIFYIHLPRIFSKRYFEIFLGPNKFFTYICKIESAT